MARIWHKRKTGNSFRLPLITYLIASGQRIGWPQYPTP